MSYDKTGEDSVAQPEAVLPRKTLHPMRTSCFLPESDRISWDKIKKPVLFKRIKLLPAVVIICLCAFTKGFSQNEGNKGIWISNQEISSLPMSGSAWQNLLSWASQSTRNPNISDQNDPTNVRVLAKALVYARTGRERFREDVINACASCMGTERGARTLAVARELGAYVIAADLVGLPPDIDKKFQHWLRSLLTMTLKGRTLQSTQEDRPNNWGTHAGATRAAIARYLGDAVELEKTALIFKGYLGDRETYAGFSYGDLSWQADPARPVGINPKGSSRAGESIDGVMPDDMRRGGQFRFPPNKTGYPWEGLQGAVVLSEILYRAGYDVWEWEDRALLRAVVFLYSIGWSAEGDDTWTPWLINCRYGTDFPTFTPTRPGKNVGFTDWTHGPRTNSQNTVN